MAVTIKAVPPGTPAARAGLQAGMQIVSVNGHAVDDGLDYEFYTADTRLEMVVSAGGEQRRLLIDKDEYQPLGCQFATYLAARQRACKNRCVFCFIDQLPKGMRPSLYFKDDDERLGFLFGNYITLTNLAERELQRIIDMRFSPVNISVHTVNPGLRVQMMGNPDAGRALDAIPRLAKAGIAMNFQLVLCPGINDGARLEESINRLAGFYPAAQSIAVVPVGLTRHRQGLPPLSAYTAQDAATQLDLMLAAGGRLAAQHGVRLVYPSDEWFLLAGREIPPADFYDGYPQLENGVGMWRSFHDAFMDALADTPAKGQKAEADVAVGTAAEGLFAKLAEALRHKLPGAVLHVHAVKNHFFGGNVCVTGLLTGQDIAAQLKGRLQSGRLLLPENTLRAEGDVMLDDMTPEALSEALGIPVQVTPMDGAALLGQIMEE